MMMEQRLSARSSSLRSSLYHLLPDAWQGAGASPLADRYRQAFASAKELYVLNAFLTEWPQALVLNRKCEQFLLVIGTDFGTTRRSAVAAALRWLPKRFEGCIRAFNQRGVNFHPKIVLWRESDGRCWMLVGSSNLTKAAFEKNVEANVTLQLSEADWTHALAWVVAVKDRSVEVHKGWLANYVEAPPRGQGRQKGGAGDEQQPVFDLSLQISGAVAQREFSGYLKSRRAQRRAFDRNARGPLEELFRQAARKRRWGAGDRADFYQSLRELWVETGTRLGGDQWVITGKDSDFGKLARSFVAILDCSPARRDAVVREEMDRLQKAGIPTRGAVLTELLCHFFPTDYPLLDKPVRTWRSRVGFDRSIGGTQGERYLRLALAMRAALRDDGPRNLGLKDLPELDTLIWFLHQRTVRP